MQLCTEHYHAVIAKYRSLHRLTLILPTNMMPQCMLPKVPDKGPLLSYYQSTEEIMALSHSRAIVACGSDAKGTFQNYDRKHTR